MCYFYLILSRKQVVYSLEELIIFWIIIRLRFYEHQMANIPLPKNDKIVRTLGKTKKIYFYIVCEWWLNQLHSYWNFKISLRIVEQSYVICDPYVSEKGFVSS